MKRLVIVLANRQALKPLLQFLKNTKVKKKKEVAERDVE